MAGENRCFIKDKIGSCCRTDVNFYVSTHSHVVAISIGLQHNPSRPEAGKAVFPIRVSPDFVPSELATDLGTRNGIAGAVSYRALYRPFVAAANSVAFGTARLHAVHSLLDKERSLPGAERAYSRRRSRTLFYLRQR